MNVFRSSHQNLGHNRQRRSLPSLDMYNYHSALGYLRKQFRIVSTFSQLSRHSWAYLFFVLISTISKSYPHFFAYFFLFFTLSLSMAHSRGPFHSITPPPWFAARIITNLLPPPSIADLRYIRCRAANPVRRCY